MVLLWFPDVLENSPGFILQKVYNVSDSNKLSKINEISHDFFDVGYKERCNFPMKFLADVPSKEFFSMPPVAGGRID